MNYQEFKDLVFAEAKAKGLTEYELYYEQSASTEVGAFGGEINAFSGSDDAGACFFGQIRHDFRYRICHGK